MQRIALFLIILIGACQLSVAALLVFEDHNFRMEVPSHWQVMEPPPPQTVIAAQSADGLKSLFVTATKFPEKERSSFSRDMIAGARKSTLDKGWEITNERETTLGGVPFNAFTTRLPTGGSIVTYIGVAGNEGYIFQGLCKNTDAESDPEIGAAIKSFSLLSARDADAETSRPNTPAYRVGYLLGVLFLGLLAWGVIWLMRQVRKKR